MLAEFAHPGPQSWAKRPTPRDPVVSGVRGALLRGSACAGGGAKEGRVDDLNGDLNSGLVPKYDAGHLNGAPIRRAVCVRDALGERAGAAGHLCKRNVQGLFEDPQAGTPVSSRMSLIVWQVVVPGVQMVTLAHGSLA